MGEDDDDVDDNDEDDEKELYSESGRRLEMR